MDTGSNDRYLIEVAHQILDLAYEPSYLSELNVGSSGLPPEGTDHPVENTSSIRDAGSTYELQKDNSESYSWNRFPNRDDHRLQTSFEEATPEEIGLGSVVQKVDVFTDCETGWVSCSELGNGLSYSDDDETSKDDGSIERDDIPYENSRFTSIHSKTKDSDGMPDLIRAKDAPVNNGNHEKPPDLTPEVQRNPHLPEVQRNSHIPEVQRNSHIPEVQRNSHIPEPSKTPQIAVVQPFKINETSQSQKSSPSSKKTESKESLDPHLKHILRSKQRLDLSKRVNVCYPSKPRKKSPKPSQNYIVSPKKDSTAPSKEVISQTVFEEKERKDACLRSTTPKNAPEGRVPEKPVNVRNTVPLEPFFEENSYLPFLPPSPAHYYDEEDLVAILTKPKSPIERDDLDNGRSEYNNQWPRDDSFGDFESPLSNDLSTSSGVELSTPPGGLENPLLLHNPSPSPSLPSQSPTSLVPFDSNTIQTNSNLNASSLDFTHVVSNKVSESPEVSFLLSDSNQPENKPSAKSKKSIESVVTSLKVLKSFDVTRSPANSNCADSSETIENPVLISNENISFASDVSIQSKTTTIADPFSATNRLHLEILPESQTTISNSELPEYPNEVFESRENFSFKAQNVKLFKISENSDEVLNSDFEKKDSPNDLEGNIKAKDDIKTSPIMPKISELTEVQSMKHCEQMVRTHKYLPKIDRKSDFAKNASGASGSGHFDSVQNTADLKVIFKVVEGHNLGDSFKDQSSAPNYVSTTDSSNLDSFESSGKENSDGKPPLNPPNCKKEVQDHKDTEKKIKFTDAKDAYKIRNGISPLNSVMTSEMIFDKGPQARDSVADTSPDLNSACESHASRDLSSDSLQQSIPHQESLKEPLITPKYDRSINAQETKDFQNKIAEMSDSNHVRDAPEGSYVNSEKIAEVDEDTCNRVSVKDLGIKSNEKPREVPLKLDKSVPNSISGTNLLNSDRQKNPRKKTEELPHISKNSGGISVIDLTKGDDHENLNSSNISENIRTTFSNDPSEPNSLVTSQRKKSRKKANIDRGSQLTSFTDSVEGIPLSNCIKSASASSLNILSRPKDTESSNIIVDHEKMRKIADKIASNARNATKASKVDEETKLTESAVIGQKPKEVDIVVTSNKEIPRQKIQNTYQLFKSANGSSTLDVNDSLNENKPVALESSVKKNSRLKTSEVAKNKVPSKEVKSSETANFVETMPRRSTRKNYQKNSKISSDSENKLINKLEASDDMATSSKCKIRSELTDRTANPHCSFEAPLPMTSKATKGGSSLSQRRGSVSTNKTILSNNTVSEVPLKPDKFAKEAEGQAALPTERGNGLKVTRERRNARMSPWCKPKKDLTLNYVEEKGSKAVPPSDPLRRIYKAEVNEENKNDVGPNGSSYMSKTDSKSLKKLSGGNRVSTNSNGPSLLVRLDLTKIHPLLSDGKTVKVLSVNNKKKGSLPVRRSGSSIPVEKDKLLDVALKNKLLPKTNFSSLKEPRSHIVEKTTTDDNKPELTSPVQPFSSAGKIVNKKSSLSITENKKSTSKQILKNKRSSVSSNKTKKQPTDVRSIKHDQSESKVTSFNGETVQSSPAEVLEPCDQSSSSATLIKTNSSDEVCYKPFNVPPKKRPVNIRKQANVGKFETPISSLMSGVESKPPAYTSFSNSDKKETAGHLPSADDVESGKILESEVARTYSPNVNAFAIKTSPHIAAPLEKSPEKSLVPNDDQETGIYLTLTSCEDSRTKSSKDLKNLKSVGQMRCAKVSRNSLSSTVPCIKNKKSPLLNNKSSYMESLISPETPASSTNKSMEEEIVLDDTKTETLSVNMGTSVVPVAKKNDDITCNIQTFNYLSSPVETAETKSKVTSDSNYPITPITTTCNSSQTKDSSDAMGDSSNENKEIAKVQIFTMPENHVPLNTSLIPGVYSFIGNDKNKEIPLIVEKEDSFKSVCEKRNLESPQTCTNVDVITSDFRGNLLGKSHSLANIVPFNEMNEKNSSIDVTSVCAEMGVEFPQMCTDDKRLISDVNSESFGSMDNPVKFLDKNRKTHDVIENSVSGERVDKLLQACAFDKGSVTDDKDDSQSLTKIEPQRSTSGITQDTEKETSSAIDKGITNDKENSHSLKTIDTYVQFHDRNEENPSADITDAFTFVSERSDATLSKTCTENEGTTSNVSDNEYPQSLTSIDSTVLFHDKNEESPSVVVIEDSVPTVCEKRSVELSKTCTENGGTGHVIAENSHEHPQSLSTINSTVQFHDKNEESPSTDVADPSAVVGEKIVGKLSKTCTENEGTTFNVSENSLEDPQSLTTIHSTVLLHDKNEENPSVVVIEDSVPPVCLKRYVELSKTCTENGRTGPVVAENSLEHPQSLSTIDSTVQFHDKNEESPSVVVIEDSVLPVCEKRFVELSKTCTENLRTGPVVADNSHEHPQSLSTIDSTVQFHDKNEESPSVVVIEDSVPPVCEKRYVELSKTCTETGRTGPVVAENSHEHPQSLSTIDSTVQFHDKNEESPSVVAIEDSVPPVCEKRYVELSKTCTETGRTGPVVAENSHEHPQSLSTIDSTVQFHDKNEESPSVVAIEDSVPPVCLKRYVELSKTCTENGRTGPVVAENSLEHPQSLSTIDSTVQFHDKNEESPSVVVIEDSVPPVCEKRFVELSKTCTETGRTGPVVAENSHEHPQSLSTIDSTVQFHDKNEESPSVVVIEDSVPPVCEKRFVELSKTCTENLRTGPVVADNSHEHPQSLSTIDSTVQFHDKNEVSPSVVVIEDSVPPVCEKRYVELSKTCTETGRTGPVVAENSHEHPQSLSTINSTVQFHDKNEESPSTDVAVPSAVVGEKIVGKLSKTCTENEGTTFNVSENSLEDPQSLTTIHSTVLLHDKNEENPSVVVIEDSVPPVCLKRYVELSKTCTETGRTGPVVAENSHEHPQSLSTIDSTVQFHDKNEESPSVVVIEDSVLPVREKRFVELSKTCTENLRTGPVVADNSHEHPQSLSTIDSTVQFHDKNEESPSVVAIEDSVPPVCEKRYVELSKTCTENGGTGPVVAENSLEHPQSLSTIDSTVLFHDKTKESTSIGVIDDSVLPVCEERFVELLKTCTENLRTGPVVVENSHEHRQSLTTIDNTVKFQDKNEEGPSIIVIEDSVASVCEKRYVEFSQTCTELEAKNSKLLTTSDNSVGFHTGKEEGPSIYFVDGLVISSTESRDDVLPQSSSEDESNKDISPDVTEGKETIADIIGDKETLGNVIDGKEKVSDGTDEKETLSDTKDKETACHVTEDRETSYYTKGTKTLSGITLGKETLSGVTEKTQTPCDINEAEITACNVTKDRETLSEFTEDKVTLSVVTEDTKTACNVTEDTETPFDFTEAREKECEVIEDRETASYSIEDKNTTTDFSADKEIVAAVTTTYDVTKEKETVCDITGSGSSCDVTEDKDTVSEVPEDKEIAFDDNEDRETISHDTEDKEPLPDVTSDKEPVSEFTEEKEAACDLTGNEERAFNVTKDKKNSSDFTKDKEAAYCASGDNDITGDVSGDKETACDLTKDKETACDVTECRGTAAEITKDNKLACNITKDKESPYDVTSGKESVSEVTEDKEAAYDITEGKQRAYVVTEGKEKVSDVSGDREAAPNVTKGKAIASDVTWYVETVSGVTEDKGKPSDTALDKEKASGDKEAASYSPSLRIIGKNGSLTECKDVEPVRELYDSGSKDNLSSDKTPSVLQTTSEMVNPTVDVKYSNTKTSSDINSLVIEGGDMYSNLKCKKIQNAGIPNDPEAFDARSQRDFSEIKNLPETPCSLVPLVILHSKLDSPISALDDCNNSSTLIVDQNQRSDNSNPNTSDSVFALDRMSTCSFQPKLHPLTDVNPPSSRKRVLLDPISEGPNASKFARLSVEIVASHQSDNNTERPLKNIGCTKKRHAISNLETSPPQKTLKSNHCSTSDSFVMPIVRIENLDTKQRIMEVLMSHDLTMSPYVLKELFPKDEDSDDSYSSDNESEKYSPWSYNGFRCLARKLRRTETTKTPALPHIKSKEALPLLSETALSETSVFPQVHSETPIVSQVRPETAAVPQQLSKTEPSEARVVSQFTSPMPTESHLHETGPSKVPLSSRVRSKTTIVSRVSREPQPLSKTEPPETPVARFSSEMVTDLLEAEPTKAPLVSLVSSGTKVSSQNISMLTESRLLETVPPKVPLSSRVRSKTTVVSRVCREPVALPQPPSKTEPPETPFPRFSSEMVTDLLEAEPTKAPLVSQVSSGTKVFSQNNLSYCQKTYEKKQLRKALSGEECSPNKSRKIHEISGVSSLDKRLYNLLYSSLESHRKGPPQPSYCHYKYRHSMNDDDGFLGFLPCLKHGVSLGEKPSCDCSPSRIPIPCQTTPPTSLRPSLLPLPSQNPSTKASPPKHSPTSNDISSERHSNNAKFPSCKMSSPQCPISNLAKPTKNDKEVRSPRPAVRLRHDEWGRCQRPKKVLPWDSEMTSYGMALPDDQPPSSVPKSSPSQPDELLIKER